MWVGCGAVGRCFITWTVWPDWAIFERSWWHGFHPKSPKCMVNFWAKVKCSNFHVQLLRLLFGQLLENFGLLFKLVSGHSEHGPQLEQLSAYESFPARQTLYVYKFYCAQYWRPSIIVLPSHTISPLLTYASNQALMPALQYFRIGAI